MIPLFKVYMAPDTGAIVNKTLYSGFVGEGPVVKAFEHVLSEYLKTTRVLATNSASSALEMAVRMICHPIKSLNGYKFLTTALTCTATNWPLVHNCQWPTWVDIDPTTLNMDLEDLKSKLCPFTSGIVVTHWGGRSHDMEALHKIQIDFKNQYGKWLPVIEDCAHGFGGFYQGHALGRCGTYGVYSFQAIKPLTCGDGGCLISRSAEDHERAKLMRWYGIDRDNRDADIEEPGFKYHMNDLAASLGMGNFLGAFQNVQKNIENAEFYLEHLKDDVTLLAPPAEDIVHPWWLFTVLLDRREDFIRAMRDRGVETGIAHKRNDNYKCMAIFKNDLPNLDSIQERYVNIPVGWWLSVEDRDHVVASIKKGW